MTEQRLEHCNNCLGMRNHALIHREEQHRTDGDDDFSITTSDTYEMLRCCGCDQITVSHISENSEDCNPESGEPIQTKTYYPPAISRSRPKWFHELYFGFSFENNVIQDLLNEIYIALQNECPRLAVMGIRALLEHIMIDKVGDQGSFKKNLDEFEKQGFLSKTQREVVEPSLDVGHAAIHRGFKPKPSDVNNLVDIAESILESVYINGRRKEILSQSVAGKKRTVL